MYNIGPEPERPTPSYQPEILGSQNQSSTSGARIGASYAKEKAFAAKGDDLTWLNNTWNTNMDVRKKYDGHQGASAYGNMKTPGATFGKENQQKGYEFLGGVSNWYYQADRKNRVNYLIFGEQITEGNSPQGGINVEKRATYMFDLATAKSILTAKRNQDTSEANSMANEFKNNDFELSNVRSRVQARLQKQNYGSTGFGGFF